MIEILAKTPVVIVAAMSQPDQIIGKGNQLLWHIPEDLKRFKSLTLGHPIIMGRKTFDSIINILKKPLPGRTNIVITRNKELDFPGVKIAHSLDEAISIAEAEEPAEIHIGGGGEIYREALPLASLLHITWIKSDTQGDTTFPEFLDNFIVTTEHSPQQYKDIEFQWVDYERR